MKATTKAAIGIAAALVIGGIVAAFVPGVKGPVNRAVITANEKLNDEYVVDNYKAEAIALVEKRRDVVANLKKFATEQKVVEKKLEYAKAKEKAAKDNLIATGTDDLTKFNRAKEAYELCRTESSNLNVLVGVYASAVSKLEDTLAVIDSNIGRCRVNVATLQSKKAMADSLKSVNTTIENLAGIGEDHGLGTSLERLDDTILTESIKIEAMSTDTTVGSKEDANAYIEAIRTIND